MIFYHNVPPGTLLLEACDGILRRCVFCKEAPGESFHPIPPEGVIAEAVRQIDEYFAGARREFDLPLQPATTAFGAAVRRALGLVPYGATTDYGSLAALAGHPGCARATGNTLGANSFHIIVPCHRIIRSDGALGGYAGGAAAKIFLLKHERN